MAASAEFVFWGVPIIINNHPFSGSIKIKRREQNPANSRTRILFKGNPEEAGPEAMWKVLRSFCSGFRFRAKVLE